MLCYVEQHILCLCYVTDFIFGELYEHCYNDYLISERIVHDFFGCVMMCHTFCMSTDTMDEDMILAFIMQFIILVLPEYEFS